MRVGIKEIQKLVVWGLSEGVESLVNESGRNGNSDDGNATVGMKVGLKEQESDNGSDGGDAGDSSNDDENVSTGMEAELKQRGDSRMMYGNGSNDMVRSQ